MSKEIWVALIAAGAAVVGPLLSWVVARQTRADDRTNITRDLEILKGLNPDSEPHKLLQERVDKNIRRLVVDQDTRDRSRLTLQLYFWLVTLVILGAAASWLIEQDWLPEGLRAAVRALEILAPILSLAIMLILMWITVRIVWLVVLFGWLKVQKVWLRFQLRRGEKRARVLEQGLKEEMIKAVSAGQTREDMLLKARASVELLGHGDMDDWIDSTMELYDQAAAEINRTSEPIAPQRSPTPAPVVER